MAGGNTPNYGFTYAGDEVSPDPVVIQTLAESIDGSTALIVVFDDENERLSRMPLPRAGQQTWLRNRQRLDVYRNGQWEPMFPVIDIVATYLGAARVGPFRLVSGTKGGCTTDANGNTSIALPPSTGSSVVAAIASIVVNDGTSQNMWAHVLSCTTTTLNVKIRRTTGAANGTLASYTGTGLRVSYMVLLQE